ncbi:hypothetical protein CEXT_516891 [Caerostris extrusa]|uniref:Uncharacterized protein n=1 Tax=Caerostris extrusa TaxID=172846 RepID=A0AAV4YFR2_CAEEX|nr:hypothetical protein CEXT_516891 [Caerostris extrusa]
MSASGIAFRSPHSLTAEIILSSSLLSSTPAIFIEHDNSSQSTSTPSEILMTLQMPHLSEEMKDQKRQFDPWGGKKRSHQHKRQFSPWGGKRSPVSQLESSANRYARDASMKNSPKKRSFNSWSSKNPFLQKSGISVHGTVKEILIRGVPLGWKRDLFSPLGWERDRLTLGLERDRLTLGLERDRLTLGLERDRLTLGLERELLTLGLERELLTLGLERDLSIHGVAVKNLSILGAERSLLALGVGKEALTLGEGTHSTTRRQFHTKVRWKSISTK